MRFFYTILIFLLLLPVYLPAKEQLSSDPLLESARKGNIHSQLLLADAFFFGKGGRKINPTLAVYWYRKAADSGSAQAQYNLGVCFEHGWGIQRSLLSAYDSYTKAAEQKLTRAVIRRAQLLYSGIPDEQAGKIKIPGLQRSPEQALSLLRKESSPEAYHALAVLLLKDTANLQKNAVEIRTLLEKAAAAPEVQTETLLHLATVLQNGIGGAPDQKRAADLLEAAAERKHPVGMTRYGKLLEHGFGRKPNPEQALQLYKEAAAKGDPESMFELARNLKSGFHTQTDLKNAFKLFKRSAERGYHSAFAAAGDCFRYGYGTSPSPDKAFEYYIRGARLGEAEAQFKTGECFRLAIGVPEDPEGAVFWYRKSAENGNPAALRRLAISLLTGYGIKKDITSGTNMLKKAAERGDREAEKLLIQWSN